MRRFATIGLVVGLVVGLGATQFQSSGLPGREVSASEASLLVGGACGNYKSQACGGGTCPGTRSAAGQSPGDSVPNGGCSGTCVTVGVNLGQCG